MARFDGGWVKLLRRVRTGPIGSREGNSCLGLWCRILLMANREESEIDWDDGERKIGPGELVTSLPELANSDRPADILKTRRDLAFLEKRQTIRQTTSERGRIITICNWEKYSGAVESFEMAATDQPTGTRQTDDRQATDLRHLNGEVREVEKERNGEETTLAGAIQKSDSTAPRRAAVSPEGTSATALTWRAYKAAYRERYSTDPVWNAKVGGQLRSLTSRVPAGEAPEVAAFYLTHNSRRYVEAGHSVGLLLMDAEKLHTEWQTGNKTTQTAARQLDRKQANFDAWAPLLAKAEAAERGTEHD